MGKSGTLTGHSWAGLNNVLRAECVSETGRENKWPKRCKGKVKGHLGPGDRGGSTRAARVVLCHPAIPMDSVEVAMSLGKARELPNLLKGRVGDRCVCVRYVVTFVGAAVLSDASTVIKG